MKVRYNLPVIRSDNMPLERRGLTVSRMVWASNRTKYVLMQAWLVWLMLVLLPHATTFPGCLEETFNSALLAGLGKACPFILGCHVSSCEQEFERLQELLSLLASTLPHVISFTLSKYWYELPNHNRPVPRRASPDLAVKGKLDQVSPPSLTLKCLHCSLIKSILPTLANGSRLLKGLLTAIARHIAL